MPIDKTAYRNLERSFEAQVIRDRAHAIERVVQKWGVYLPCVEPESQVDYVLVGMEPSSEWYKCIEHGEKMVAEGFRNFHGPRDEEERLALYAGNDRLAFFILSIEHYLRQPGEKTYHLTDIAKGAVSGEVAALDRERRYREWYPMLLEEIEMVGKPDAPVIAIGRDVENFLVKRDLKGTTGRSLHAVLHYSFNASASIKREAEKDPEGFEAFTKSEFGGNSRWVPDPSLAKKRMLFVYKKRFEAIRDSQRRAVA